MNESTLIHCHTCRCLETPILITSLPFFSFVYFIVISIIATTSNMSVIMAVIIDPYNNLKTPFNYFLVNLSASDLFMGVVPLPILGYKRFLEYQGRNSTNLNNYVHISYFVSTCVSTFGLIAVTFDRYLAIQWPIYYRTKINLKRSACISVFIWLASMLITTGYLFAGYIRFMLIFTSLQVLTTAFILVFVYIGVYRRFLKQHKTFGDAESSSDEQLQKTKNGDLQIKKETIRRSSSYTTSTKLFIIGRNKKVLTSFELQLIAFLTYGIPATVMIYVLNFCSTCNCLTLHIIRDMVLILVLTTSAINPFLLSLRLPCFQKALAAILSWNNIKNKLNRKRQTKKQTKKSKINRSEETF